MARLSLKEWRKLEGLESVDQFTDRLAEIVSDSVCPVLCDECDDVEPDGHCEHGHPSVLIAAGLM